MLQFFGEFVEARPASSGKAPGGNKPASVQVQFLNQPAEWFTVEGLIQVYTTCCCDRLIYIHTLITYIH